jgi:NAD(P)-dependent dehydrogenase (short-subunit alcohol dehydrogenase family)
MLNLVDLSDHHVLVTGASAGLGQETALLLARLGARVTLVARDKGRLDETICRLEGRDHRAISWDLSDFDAIPDLVKQSVDALGPLDGLVHCAGVQIMRPVSMLTANHLDQTLRLNVNAALGLVKSLASPGQFRKPASCVLLASVMGMVGQPVQAAYSASKGALIAMARSLALELARQQVRVNCVAPSVVAAGMGLAIEKNLAPEQFEKVVQLHPLGLGKALDVASAVAFLVSGAARWITGTTLVVDGGYTAQ